MPLSVTLALFALSMPALPPRRLNAVTGDLEDLFDLVTVFVPVARLPKALSLLGKSRVLRKVTPKPPKAPKTAKPLELSRRAKARLGVEKAIRGLQDNGFKIIAEEVEFEADGFGGRTRCDLVVARKISKNIFCIEVKYSKDGKFTFTPNQRLYHQHDSLVGRFIGPNANGHREITPQKLVSVGMHQMCYRGEDVVSDKCRFPKK